MRASVRHGPSLPFIPRLPCLQQAGVQLPALRMVAGSQVLLKLDGIGDIAEWSASPSLARQRLDECLVRLESLKVVYGAEERDNVSSNRNTFSRKNI